MAGGARLLPAVIVVALIVWGAPLQAGVAAAQPQFNLYPEEIEGDYFEVGMSISLSGGLADYGAEALCAIKAMIDWINDRGGIFIKGQRYYVRLVYADDGSDPSRALEIYKALYGRGVDIFLSPLEAPMTSRVLEDFLSQEDVDAVMFLWGATTERVILENKDKIVGVIEPPIRYIEGALHVASLLEEGARIVVVHDRSRLWSAAAAPAQRIAGDYGVEVVGRVSYSIETIDGDVDLIVSTVEREKPDILLIVGDEEGVAELVKRLYGKVSVKLVMIAGAGSTQAFQLIVGPIASQDTLVVVDWVPKGSHTVDEAQEFGLPWFGPNYEVFRRYMSEKCPAIEPSYIAARAGVTLIYLAYVMSKANTFDPAKIRETALSEGVLTFYAPIVIDPFTSISSARVHRVAQWDQGKLKYLGEFHIDYSAFQPGQVNYPSRAWYKGEVAGEGETVDVGAAQRPQQEEQQAPQQVGGTGGGAPSSLLLGAAIIIVLAAAGLLLARRKG